MVVETFRNGDPVPVYRRFRDRGRLAPEGLTYVSSWVDHRLERCYQVMETEDRALLDQWITSWSDIVDFEVHPVISSKEAAERIAPRLAREGRRPTYDSDTRLPPGRSCRGEALRFRSTVQDGPGPRHRWPHAKTASEGEPPGGRSI
ncbi:MAG: hypothetical protein DMD79_23505 [Candidatus Rokuibacteriota bacterium]|nr:MAG: hypothetical protein DMD79_23505 [Candidatus Rokubacteria bacterium]